MIPPQNFLPWKICLSILHGFAILTTLLRLEHRRRSQRLWWDDYATIVPLLVEGPHIAVIWLRYRHGVPSSDKILLSFSNQVIFNTLNWWSRISLAFAVIRIIPICSKNRRLARALPVAFFLFWISLSAGMVATCAIHKKWQSSTSQIVGCGPAYHVTIASTILDALGDIALLIFPLYQLRNATRRRRSERCLVRLVFSASVLTMLSSFLLCIVSYGGFLVGPGWFTVWLMVCHINTAVSIITSNFLVLICWARHLLSTDVDRTLDIGDIHFTPHWSKGKGPTCFNDPASSRLPDALPASHIFQAADAETLSVDMSVTGYHEDEESNVKEITKIL